MNWGKGIAITLMLFMGFITYMVVGFFMHRVDLESEDYYQQEIAYESEIQSLNNANLAQHKPTVSVNESHVVVQFNEGFDDAIISFKRPNDQQLDRSFKIDKTNTFTMDLEEFTKGVYWVELSYQSEGLQCLHKEEIYIQ